MVSEPLLSRLRAFITEVGEPYICVEAVSDEGLNSVRNQALRFVITRDEASRALALLILEESWRQNTTHGRRRDWGRLASGIAQYLLILTSESETSLPEAVDVIVRLTRWNYS